MAALPFVATLVIDAGPIISNTNLPKAGSYYTTPAVFAELKDESTRSRLATIYDLQIRSPKKESLDFVRGFSKKTGDSEVLSSADIGIIALTYELECEQNGGDWRLRRTPGQSRINGSPPVKSHVAEASTMEHEEAIVEKEIDDVTQSLANTDVAQVAESIDNESLISPSSSVDQEVSQHAEEPTPDLTTGESAEDEDEKDTEEEDSDEDGGDWITPSNLKQHQERDSNIDGTAQDVKPMKVACATHDFALQNVLLQIGLNLISGDGKRISSVKTWVLRCHACFKITRKMNQKFCPICGGATLMRTSMSTDSKGAMKVHLKRNMQWNNRGTVYSIPNQQHGTANMKGRENLILRADQREVEKLEKRDKYKKEIDLLDPDYIPSIVSGRRDMTRSSVRFGHGKRNPNSNKKH